MSMSIEAEGYPQAQFRKTYFEECAELLDGLQTNLELLSNGNGDEETLHAIFRSVHSIKGGAGAFGFSDLVAFSHVFESLLDAMREHKIAATPDVTQILLRASDALADIVSAARDEQSVAADFAADIVTAMEETLHGAAGPLLPTAQSRPVAESAELSGDTRDPAYARDVHCVVCQPARSLLRRQRQSGEGRRAHPAWSCLHRARRFSSGVGPQWSELRVPGARAAAGIRPSSFRRRVVPLGRQGGRSEFRGDHPDRNGQGWLGRAARDAPRRRIHHRPGRGQLCRLWHAESGT
jgi:HPt (histidine-containing phosphotransfer) domain-containing protein